MCHLELQVGGTCKERGATGTVWNLKLNTSNLGDARVWQRAFANHFLSRLQFVGLRSPNKNKYHSTADTCSYSTSGYFYDPYNSRDLNPTEPTNHGCGSRRE